MQYAHTVRPIIGWGVQPAVDLELSDTPIGDHAWRVDMFNGGGGVARIEQVTYRTTASEAATPPKWLDFRQALVAIGEIGLVRGRDFVLIERGVGMPLPAVTKIGDGVLLAIFRTSAIRRLGAFEIRIRIRDSVGDVHERVLDCSRRFPPFALVDLDPENETRLSDTSEAVS
jgi:hypothetical protein